MSTLYPSSSNNRLPNALIIGLDASAIFAVCSDYNHIFLIRMSLKNFCFSNIFPVCILCSRYISLPSRSGQNDSVNIRGKLLDKDNAH